MCGESARRRQLDHLATRDVRTMERWGHSSVGRASGLHPLFAVQALGSPLRLHHVYVRYDSNRRLGVDRTSSSRRPSQQSERRDLFGDPVGEPPRRSPRSREPVVVYRRVASASTRLMVLHAAELARSSEATARRSEAPRASHQTWPFAGSSPSGRFCRELTTDSRSRSEPVDRVRRRPLYLRAGRVDRASRRITPPPRASIPFRRHRIKLATGWPRTVTLAPCPLDSLSTACRFTSSLWDVLAPRHNLLRMYS